MDPQLVGTFAGRGLPRRAAGGLRQYQHARHLPDWHGRRGHHPVFARPAAVARRLGQIMRITRRGWAVAAIELLLYLFANQTQVGCLYVLSALAAGVWLATVFVPDRALRGLAARRRVNGSDNIDLIPPRRRNRNNPKTQNGRKLPAY